MDITDRFAELVRGPEERCQLDLGALLIAAHARRDLDVDAQLQRMDELAAGCPGSDVEALTNHEITICLAGGAILGPFRATWTKETTSDVRELS